MTAICILARLRKTLQDFTFTKATQLCFYCSAPLLTLLSSANAAQLCLRCSALLALLSYANASQFF